MHAQFVSYIGSDAPGGGWKCLACVGFRAQAFSSSGQVHSIEMWGELQALPDLLGQEPAHGGMDCDDLPDLHEHEQNTNPASQGLSHVPAYGGSHACFGLPEMPDVTHDSATQTPSQKQKWSDRPYLRAEAIQDIPSVAAKYGADLLDVPGDWLDCTRAWQFLMTKGITLTMTLPVFCMEVFAGCAHGQVRA